jgi:hypothetical protein
MYFDQDIDGPMPHLNPKLSTCPYLLSTSIASSLLAFPYKIPSGIILGAGQVGQLGTQDVSKYGKGI